MTRDRLTIYATAGGASREVSEVAVGKRSLALRPGLASAKDPSPLWCRRGWPKPARPLGVFTDCFPGFAPVLTQERLTDAVAELLQLASRQRQPVRVRLADGGDLLAQPQQSPILEVRSVPVEDAQPVDVPA